MTIIIFKILIIALLMYALWNMYRDAIAQQQQRKLYIPKDNTPIKREPRTVHNTKRLADILKNAPQDKKPYIPVKTIGKFDRRKYDEIMAQDEESKSKNVSSYQQEIYTDSGEIDTNWLDRYVSDTIDTVEKATDTEQKQGILMCHVALAKEKQKQTTEAISISVPDTLTCDKCSYKANSIKGLNGHKKRHSTKE